MTGRVLLAALLAAAALGLGVARTAAPRPEPVAAEPSVVEDTSRGRLLYPAGHYPSLTLPDGKTREVRSLLDVRHRFRFGEYAWNDAGVPPGPTWVRVDLARQSLSVFRGGHEIGTTLILFGADGRPTPTGMFPILERAAHHRSTLYDAEMPYMLRLTSDGVAIHASNVRDRAATHGCIGVPADFARLLFNATRRGDTVAIVGEGRAGAA